MNLLRHIDPLTKVLLFSPLHEMTASVFQQGVMEDVDF